MKNSIMLSTLLPSVFNIAQQTDFNIVDEWKNIEGKAVYFKFDKEGFVYFDTEKIQTGKEFIVKGKKRSMRYEIDNSKFLKEIKIIYQTLDNSELEKTMFIVNIISNNKIEILPLKDSKHLRENAYTFIRKNN